MTELEELAGILVYPVRFVDRDGDTRVGEVWLDDAQKLAQAILGAGYHKSTSQNLVEAGIKEVVDWIQSNKQTIPIFWPENIKFVLEVQAWQSKLKEWGIQ